MRGSQSLTTSRSSTTASGSTRRWATAPRSKYSPNTRRQQPLHDQLPEKLSKIVDTPQWLSRFDLAAALRVVLSTAERASMTEGTARLVVDRKPGSPRLPHRRQGPCEWPGAGQ